MTEFLKLNEEILKIDLINKGIMNAETWEQIDRVVLKLQEATAQQTEKFLKLPVNNYLK